MCTHYFGHAPPKLYDDVQKHIPLLFCAYILNYCLSRTLYKLRNFSPISIVINNKTN